MEISDEKEKNQKAYQLDGPFIHPDRRLPWARVSLGDGVFGGSQCPGSTRVQVPQCYSLWRF